MVQILVIDDDPTIRVLIGRTLSKNGYEVIFANDGTEGLEKAYQASPSLIICDWLMPGLDGLQVCRQIKSTPELFTTFFILLTALGSVEYRIEGLDAGADDFLCKPIEMSELIARVKAGLRLYQLNHDLQQQKQLLEAELAEAADYVCSILPEPLTTSHLNIDFRFIPSHQLGGDSLDYYWLDPDHLVIYLLDVSGHGLRAALPSLSVINLLRSQSLNQVNYYHPQEVLTALNHTFQMTPKNDKYFTIWYGVYDKITGNLTYSTAGHPPGILLLCDSEEQGKKELLKTPGLPIGMFNDTEYFEKSCQIHPGDTLYIFSDGVYEIEQENGKLLGIERFTNLLIHSHNQSSGNLDLLINTLKIHHDKPSFYDDLSLLKISFQEGK